MSGEETQDQGLSAGNVSYGVKVEDGVVEVDLKARIDLIEIMKKESAKTTNTIDDTLVKIVEMARGNMDWKGYAKEHLF